MVTYCLHSFCNWRLIYSIMLSSYINWIYVTFYKDRIFSFESVIFFFLPRIKGELSRRVFFIMWRFPNEWLLDPIRLKSSCSSLFTKHMIQIKLHSNNSSYLYMNLRSLSEIFSIELAKHSYFLSSILSSSMGISERLFIITNKSN